MWQEQLVYVPRQFHHDGPRDCCAECRCRPDDRQRRCKRSTSAPKHLSCQACVTWLDARLDGEST